MGSCTLIPLRRRTVQGEVNQYRDESTERHCHRKESDRVL